MRVGEIVAAAGLAMALVMPLARASTPMALALSDGQIRQLEQEFRDDLHALDAFARQRPAGGLSGAPLERPGPWIFYGRLGSLNFRNELEQPSLAGTRFGFGRTGPALTGRLYIGIHRRFH